MQVWIYWLIISLIFFIIEMLVPSFFFMWFGIGAIGGAIAAFLHVHIYLQIAIFVVISAILAILSQKIFKKYFFKNPEKNIQTNVDKFVGKQLITLEEINNIKETGKVKIDGVLWKTRSTDDNTIIKKGKEIIVERVEGVTVYVKVKEE